MMRLPSYACLVEVFASVINRLLQVRQIDPGEQKAKRASPRVSKKHLGLRRWIKLPFRALALSRDLVLPLPRLRLFLVSYKEMDGIGGIAGAADRMRLNFGRNAAFNERRRECVCCRQEFLAVFWA